jgi:hypothetical protein
MSTTSRDRSVNNLTGYNTQPYKVDPTFGRDVQR